MPVKKYRPTTPSHRDMTSLSYEEITIGRPEKSLLQPLKSKDGRNNNGHITTRHQGGGYRRAYRVVGFKRNKDGIPARMVTIEYDPSCSTNVALLNYTDDEKRYIIAPKGLTVGMNTISGEDADIKTGNTTELKGIPEGTFIHNIELRPGKDGQLARSAGAPAQVLGVKERYTTIRLASDEVRRVLSNCRATIGRAGNENHSLVNYGKAGRMRWEDVRSTVRSPVMNLNDHPHGGGEGRTPVERKSPMTPWGKKIMDVKTHKAKKASTKLIVRRRSSKQAKEKMKNESQS